MENLKTPTHLAVLSHLAICLAAFLFGGTFFVVQAAVKDVDPIPFIGIRFLIGAAILIPFARLDKCEPGVVKAAFITAASLIVGYIFQTVGLQYTTSSASAFLTALCVVIVPIISTLFLHKPPTYPVMAGIAVAGLGLFLLTGGVFSIGFGEGMTLLCALSFAADILLLGHFASRFNIIRFVTLQLLIVGIVCFVWGWFAGGYHFTAMAWAAAAVMGVFGSAASEMLQLWGQRRVDPSRTGLLLLIEPLTAGGVGYLVGERLSWAALLGAGLILAGIIVAETWPGEAVFPDSEQPVV